MKDLFVCVTNIPSPYRLHEFEHLSKELLSRGIRFKAYFLAVTERGRYWNFDSIKWSFNHELVKGIGVYAGDDLAFYFNPRVLLRILKHPPDWLLLGGAWYFPTVLAASIIAKLRSRQTSILFWNESPMSSRHYVASRAGLRIKKMMLGLYDGFVVPGANAAEYCRIFGDSRAKVLSLSNIVDESIYRDEVAKLRRRKQQLRNKLGLTEDRVVYLWPARLHWSKGILEFLEAIKPIPISPFKILIAGEGPQRTEIESWLHTHDADNRVVLMGHQNIDKLLELYALSDILLLPSLSEPYGFVAVEAIWAGLPLFLSNRVGSCPEVLQPGTNGWLFDPENQDQTRQMFIESLTKSHSELEKMGSTSLDTAEKRFATIPNVKSFVDQLLQQFPKERPGT